MPNTSPYIKTSKILNYILSTTSLHNLEHSYIIYTNQSGVIKIIIEGQQHKKFTYYLFNFELLKNYSIPHYNYIFRNLYYYGIKKKKDNVIISQEIITTINTLLQNY